MKNKVLIVDDVEINRIILREILAEEYDIFEAADGREALQVLSENIPHVILLDIIMPDMNGYEVMEAIKKDPRICDIPVLFITAADTDTNETRTLNMGAADFISKPFNAEVVKARVDLQVKLANYANNLQQMVIEKTNTIGILHQKILETMASIVEYRNLESGQHIERVKRFSQVLIEHMLTKEAYRKQLERLNYNDIIKATILHDIGKVGISDSILLKPGRLNDVEFNTMKLHTTIGGDIIDTIAEGLNSEDDAYLQHCRDIARYHHERWGGGGYPMNLKGEDIPLSARILSIVDVYDALVSERCYKDAFSHDEAIQIILDGKGTQFDPGITDCFMEVAPQIRQLAEELRDN